MPFPITYVLDQPALSETFIRRELEQLLRRSWPIDARYLKNGPNLLKSSLSSCPTAFRWRFFKCACGRVLSELFHAPRHALRIIRRLPQAAYLVKKVSDTDCRLIHAHFAGITADLAAIAAQTVRIPWTCGVHAHDVFTISPHTLNRRLHSVARVVACSQQAANAVLASGLPPESVSVIHHGLPINDFSFDTIQPDEAIFCACRLERKKGLDTLLQACALLLERGLHFACVIAGTGPCQHELEKLRKQLGLEQTVFFAGWLSQDETRSRMMDASMFVLPSRRMPDGDRDGIANILVEAMAIGTPIVTTTASAANEVITDGVNGLLVPPDDPAALAEKLALALTSKELLIHIAKAGRATAEMTFDGSKNVCQLEAFFKQATACSV